MQAVWGYPQGAASSSMEDIFCSFNSLSVTSVAKGLSSLGSKEKKRGEIISSA